jgi:hypothetical protein
MERSKEGGFRLYHANAQRDSEIYEQTLADIDQIVYQLYELTEEEIALVEGNS